MISHSLMYDKLFLLQQWVVGSASFPIPPSQYNPLDEPSPLGLRLKKSPSLLDLIQMTLAKGNASKIGNNVKKEHKGGAASGSTDKLKASNFPASFLRIGTWEVLLRLVSNNLYAWNVMVNSPLILCCQPDIQCILNELQYKSRYEGDLVGKCYFAKHKLVWEVLDGGLKNKIEIQWSDIVALKANYPDDGPGTLDVVVSFLPNVLVLVSLLTISYIDIGLLFFCWFSLQDNLCSSGRPTHNPGSIPYGRQHQILLVDRQPLIGNIHDLL